MVKTSRYLKIGPGGRRCNCCFPAPRSKDRRAQYRSAKRKADREAQRRIEADIEDDRLFELETQRALDMEDANWNQFAEDWSDYDNDYYDEKYDEEQFTDDDYYDDGCSDYDYIDYDSIGPSVMSH